MARSFAFASAQYLERGDVLGLTGYPLTSACWITCADLTKTKHAITFGHTATNDQEASLTITSSGSGLGANIVVAASRTAAAFSYAEASVAASSANTWYHIAAVFASATDRRAFLNGGNKGTDSGEVAWPSFNTTDIACRRRAATIPYQPHDGRIAEGAVWNVALTDAEIAILGAGYPPPVVRPQSLVAYWQEIRDTDNDIVGGYSMTAYNAPTVAAHPPVLYAVGPQMPERVAIPTDVVWGHDTAVSEDYVRNFHGTWTGTGDIENQGVADTERLALNTTEYMISEVVNTGAVDVEIEYNVYSAGDAINLDYRHGATVAACEGAGWNDYAAPFTSLGFIQVRVTSTL